MRAQDDGRAAFSPRVRHVASLSALYLARPQRLVGCSLPPHVPRATTAEGNATKGFVTLAVPHILESAASAQTLPSTSLVRFRWRHEENQRGSLFQPAKIANGGHGTHLMNADDDDIEDEASDNKIKRDGRRGSTPRSIEMVYPISVNAERFVEYLREMRELVFDVIDRDTRRIYGKCTIPIFETSSTFGSNPRGSQQTTRAEHLLEQVKREDALYEIKSVHPTDQDDMIGYLAVNLDVQFKPHSLFTHANDEVEEKANRVLYQRPQGSEPSRDVLVPRSRQTVHVNVHRHVDSRELEHDEHALSFDRASAISYLESDALHPLPDSNLRSDGSFSPLGTWSVPNERRRRPRDDSPRHVMLRDLIEKGRALQQSMAKAAHEDDSFEQLLDKSVTVSKTPDNGIHPYLDLAAYQQLTESGDENDWDVPRSTQQFKPRSPQNFAENAGPPQLPSATRLEIAFESLEFVNDFVNQLQQLRNSTISSRFSPIELAVSCNDALSKLTSNENNLANAPETSRPLFSIATSLRKRVTRLNYSHVVPIRPPVRSIATQLSSTNAKKQLEFFVRCQTQGTPRRITRRNPQGLRNGQKDFVLLRGAIPVRDVFRRVSSGKDHWAESVQLHFYDESIARNQNAKPIVPIARRKKGPQRVGEMKINFQVLPLQDSESSEHEMKGTSDMVLELVPQPFEGPRLPAIRQQLAERELESKDIKRGPGIKRRKMERPYPKTVVQLAVMIENATSVRLPEARTRRGTSNPVDVAVRVEYALPPICYVENSLVWVNSVKRTIRRKLTQTRLQSSLASTYRVNFSHVGVFPLELSRKRVQNFKKQLLIMEVWIQESDAKSTDDQLLGLVKVPLDAFSSSLIDVNDDWENAEPTVGVDERLPIVDPFSGRTSGYLRTRVAIGTAEQIITLTSTTRGITKFQAIVRGVLSRNISPFLRGKLHHDRKASSQVSSPGMSTEKWSEVHIRQRTASKIPASNESVREHETWSGATGPEDKTENVTFLHEIRIEIRDCWLAPRVSGVKKQLKSDKAPSVLGCEIQGELHIHKDASFHPRESKTVQFALWWDASNRQLNSHFVHSTQSTEPSPRVEIDKAEFTFLVENDFVRSALAESVAGKATLDLRHFFTDEDNDEASPGKLSYIYHDIDVPIKWQREENTHENLCSFLPLRISYQVSANSLAYATKLHVNELLDTSRALTDDVQNYPSSMTTTAVSTTRRLLPATIVVSTAIISVTDLKHAIEEKWSQVCAIPSERHLKKHLETVLERESASIIFECNACVGVEVDEADENGDGFLRFKKDGKWYKKLRLPAARIDVSNSQQTLSSLFHPLQISIIVHPEALQNLQEECFVVKILFWSEEQNVEYELGLVSIPVAAVLFRPSGVQGAFPIQIGEALNGRLGVQVFIDHNHENRTNVTRDGVLQYNAEKPDLELSDFRPVSPTSPEEAEIHFSPNTSQPKHSIQVSVEDFRNVQYLGSVGSSERLQDCFVTFDLEHQDGTAIDAGDADSVTTIRAERQRHRLNGPNVKSIFTSCRWGNATLQASLWHESKETDHYSADGYVVNEASTLASDQSEILIGRAYVDLSLLDAGWKEVRGWYHILDGQQISRGHVKIRAVVCSKEPSGDGIDDITSGKYVDVIESLGGDVNGEHEKLDGHQSQSPNLGSSKFLFEERFAESRAFRSTSPHSEAISSMLQGSHEIKQSIDCSPSRKADSNSDHDRASDATIEMESLGRDDGTVSINPNDTSTGVKTNSQNVGSVEFFVAQTPSPATTSTLQDGEMGAMSADQSPTVDTASAFYQPITLSSFGIDELEFSPISGEDSPAPPEVVDERLGGPVMPTNNDGSSGIALQPEEPKAALEAGNSFSAYPSPFSLHLHELPRSVAEVSLPLSMSHLSDGELESVPTGRHDAQIAVETDISAASEELHDDQSQGEDQARLNASYFSLDGSNSPRDEICTPRAEVGECTECGSDEVFPAEDQSRVHVSTIDSNSPGHLTATSPEEVDKLTSVVDSEEFSSEVNGMDQSLVASIDISVECSDDSESEEHRDSPSQKSVNYVDGESEQSGGGESDTNSGLLEESDSMGMTPKQECERCEKSTQTDAEAISAETNLDGEALPEAKIDISELVTPDLHHFDSVNTASDLGDPTPSKSGTAQSQQMGDILNRKTIVDVACGTSDDLVSYDEDIGSTDQHQVGVKDASRTIAVDKEVVVDVACGTSDDSDSYDDGIVATDHKTAVNKETSSTIAANEENTATKRHQGSSDHPSTLYLKRDAASSNQEDLIPAIESHGAGAASITGGVTHQEEPSKQALLSLSADKFDLICQLLSEIRDSCGSKVVKDLLEAPFPERRLHSEPPHEIEPQIAVRGNENVMTAPKSQPVSPRCVPTSLFTDYDEQVGSALHVSAATKSLNRPHPRKYSVSDDFARSVWSDSSTLQQEIKRRMERDIAESEDFQSSRPRSANMMQLSGVNRRVESQHVQYSRAEQLSGASSLRASHNGRAGGLFAGYNDADGPAVRGFQSLNKRPLSFKADSETERIARIMQGSINYWRKGDETLDDSDGESFDSDDDGNCFF